jgi:hypothetical protein
MNESTLDFSAAVEAVDQNLHVPSTEDDLTRHRPGP